MWTSVNSSHTLAIVSNACHCKDSAGHKTVLGGSQGIPGCYQHMGWRPGYNTALHVILYVTATMNLQPRSALTGSRISS